MDRLTAMSVFRKVVERSSFRLAAEQLGMSNASVSKYVAALEHHIGAPLLARTTRRVSLTDAGRSYYAKCARILEDLEEAEATAGQLQTTPRGLLKVRAPISLGAAHLGRTVAGFLARFREVSVELTLNDRFADPAEEGMDVALLIASNLADSRRADSVVGRWARALCAAPEYLTARGAPAAVADLKAHNCVVYSRGHAPDEWRFTRGGARRMVQVSGNCRCNNAMLLRETLLAGAGIGLLPRFLVAGDLAAGRLRAVLPGWEPEPRLLCAVYPRQRQPGATARAFTEFLAERFAADPQWRLEAPRARAA